MKVIIEKELCQQHDPYNLEWPLYHVIKVDEETGERTLLETFEKNIEEAARYAQRMLDIDVLEVAYQKDPHAFSSTGYVDLDTFPIIDIEQYEGKVINVNNNFAVVKFVNHLDQEKLINIRPDYKVGDKILIDIFKDENIQKLQNNNE